jgi:hypothetical protein
VLSQRAVARFRHEQKSTSAQPNTEEHVQPRVGATRGLGRFVFALRVGRKM